MRVLVIHILAPQPLCLETRGNAYIVLFVRMSLDLAVPVLPYPEPTANVALKLE